MTRDVRGLFAKYQPIEEEALRLIQGNHEIFISSWPKDIRGERTFLLRVGRPSQRGRGWVLASFEVVVPEFTPVARLPEDASWRGFQVPEEEVDALDEALSREVGARLLD